MSTGFRCKTKSLLVRDTEKKKTVIRRTLLPYVIGERIVLVLDSGYHKGLYHKRFYGKVGQILEVYNFTLKIKVIGTNKVLYTHCLHVKKL